MLIAFFHLVLENTLEVAFILSSSTVLFPTTNIIQMLASINVIEQLTRCIPHVVIDLMWMRRQVQLSQIG